MADYTEIAICICERFTMVACVFGTIDNYILCLINTTRKTRGYPGFSKESRGS